MILCGFLLHAIIGVAEEENETPLEVVRVSPSGSGVSTTVGRITVEFNKPIIAFGSQFQEFGEVHIEISPDVQCSWRAFETNEYTCLLDDDLEPETTYSIKVLHTAESLDGSVLGVNRQYQFKTALLSVRHDWTFWRSPINPGFRLRFSRPVALSTVLQTVLIQSQDGSEDVEVRADYERRYGISHRDFYLQDENGIWQQMSEEDAKDFVELLKKGGLGPDDENPLGDIATRQWYVEPESELQFGSSYELHLDAGAKSIFANESTEESVKFGIFDTFGDIELKGIIYLITNSLWGIDSN